MANCDGYMNLSHQEKLVTTGRLLHLFQNDQDAFRDFSSIVRGADQNGKFDSLTILPERQNDNHETIR